jgi:hypothetical protein
MSMNAYTTRSQDRMQPQDLAAVHRTHPFTAGPALAALERQHGYQAEAEVDWLLKPNRITPQASASFVSLLRQRVGTALVHAGDRLAGVPRRDVSLDPTSAAGTLGMSG